MRERIERRAEMRWFAVLLTVLVSACTQHPTEGVTDEASADEPWEDTLSISGVLAVPGGEVEIEVATNHLADEFVSLATVTASDTPLDDPNLPEMYPWKYEGTIPENRWIAGASDGYKAEVRAWYRPPDGSLEADYLLGNNEFPNTPQVCGALDFNPEMFQSIAQALEPLCLSTPSEHDLNSVFRTPDYNNGCGGEGEACCPSIDTAAGGCDHEDSNLECDEAFFRCVNPEQAPSDLEEGRDYGEDGTEECTEGETQPVDVSLDSCGDDFSVAGYVECRNGKWSEPIADVCKGPDMNLPEGTECYCIAADGFDTSDYPTACGAGPFNVCSFEKTLENHTACRPGYGCAPLWGDPGPWKCRASVDEEAPKCWKPSDLAPTTIGDCNTVGLPELDDEGNPGPVPIVPCPEGPVGFPCRDPGSNCASNSECCPGTACVFQPGASVGQCTGE